MEVWSNRDAIQLNGAVRFIAIYHRRDYTQFTRSPRPSGEVRGRYKRGWRRLASGGLLADHTQHLSGNGMTRGIYNPSAAPRPAGWRRVERRLAAIMGADIMDYSVLMGRTEESTHRRVGTELDRMIREIEKSHGRVFSFAGDGLMAEFPSAVEALKCGLRIQADTGKRNARLAPDQRIVFRIGINAGEIVLQQDRAGGNAVNIASRLEGIAEPGGIALSETVYEQVHRVVSAGYAFIGERRLRNIRDPVTVYVIPSTSCSAWAGMPALPRQTSPAGVAKEYRASLAVLPFRLQDQDQSGAYFAEGMVDDIIRALDGLKDLLVIARSSTQGFARAPLDLRRVGHELDVQYVMHGSVRRVRDSLRITVELCEAQTGTIIWVDKFDGDTLELFELQDRIAKRVLMSVSPHLRGRELSRALRKHPESMTAYDLTLKALDCFYRMERASIDEAQALLLSAIRHDPNYALAYTHFASLQMTRLGQGWAEDPDAVAAAAGRAALSAVRLDGSDALALAFYGQYQSFVLKDFSAARATHERAVAAGPNCAWAWGLSSLPLGYVGDTAAAVERAERAVRLSPLGPEAYWHEYFLAQALYLSGHFDDAVAWGKLSAAHASANTSNLRTLCAGLVASGDLQGAREVGAQLLQCVPHFNLRDLRSRTHFSGEAATTLISRLRQAGLPEEAPGE
jgi:adenylate cyclase